MLHSILHNTLATKQILRNLLYSCINGIFLLEIDQSSRSMGYRKGGIEMKSFKHRIVIGVQIGRNSGDQLLAESAFSVGSLIETVFDRRPPGELDVTVTIESERTTGRVTGRVELVTGTIETLRNSLAAQIKGTSEAKPGKKTQKHNPLSSSFIQLGIGSREFCMVFVQYWAAAIGNSAAQWAVCLTDGLKELSQPDDVLWIDLDEPQTLRRENTRRMIMANIGSLVM